MRNCPRFWQCQKLWVTSLEQVTGEGTMNLDMHASGPVKSINAQEITKALNGTINLNSANVKYSGANLSHELASIGGFLNRNASAQDTSGVINILKMTGSIAVKSGSVQTNDLQAKLDIGNIELVGTASLVSEAVNMHATAVMPQAVSQPVGGQTSRGSRWLQRSKGGRDRLQSCDSDFVP